ncbi:MAG: lipoyl(octanoyl) transferase LipB [Buchnera aphidicola (Periphyllus lyropictus)]|uniref:lipoyl(octanoyl) transferase LipB n=1 Tax=Buchnera aphidicola TaxID=9 RepID=UPI001EBE080B|nr:lipoyl(octanoyl) transferase LipB [Buchnera aphidicola]NIH16611.1 lipoyl(octanoyl) transferase LipB [Buchnera aphidicola (Periphyllus lyropictus)]USS94523.1 lipoyl(octanoyl) transferase LipB [Buchnera aphidicola (Periphyllus lyropictus)]
MKKIYVRNLKKTHWNNIFHAMHCFTDNRSLSTKDELWFTEHHPIFTKGNSEKNENIIKNLKNISVMNCDRGGKITYHGPGQQLVYILVNFKLLGINIKNFIFLIHQVVLKTLKYFFINGYIIKKFPGVYINNKKFCSIGFRIKNYCSLHGISYNINTNLTPYNYIYPCGNKSMKMINLIDLLPGITMNIFRKKFIQNFSKIFKYKIIYKSPYGIFYTNNVY